MSEEWRRKAYYRTRVLIPVDECLSSAFGDCLVCLTGGQLNLVRNLLLYAERRATFVSEYEANTYLAPTAEEWDDLQTMVADLEGNLMDCEQFTSDLQEILDWVRLQSTLPGGSFSEDEQAAFPYDDVIGDDEVDQSGADACAVSQLWYQWGYEVITEYVLPATRWGFDYLVPAVAALIALAVAGPGAVMGVWAVAEFIQELMEIGYRGAETNLVNWMDSNKKAIICSLYNHMVVGAADASYIWEFTKVGIIDPAEDISAGDKLMLNLFMGSWAGSNAQLAFAEATDWATSNVTPGYCGDCPESYEFAWEFFFPPTNGWALCNNSEWTEEGWLHVWRGDGAGCSPSLAVPVQDTYDLTIDVHFYGAPEDPDCHLYLKQDDNPATNWCVAGAYTDHAMNAPNGAWGYAQYEVEQVLNKSYLAFCLTGHLSDTQGVFFDWIKFTFTPQEP